MLGSMLVGFIIGLIAAEITNRGERMGCIGKMILGLLGAWILPNASITLEVSDEVLAERKAKYVAPEPNIKTGWLSRYARMVTSANLGAVLK